MKINGNESAPAFLSNTSRVLYGSRCVNPFSLGRPFQFTPAANAVSELNLSWRTWGPYLSIAQSLCRSLSSALFSPGTRRVKDYQFSTSQERQSLVVMAPTATAARARQPFRLRRRNARVPAGRQ